MPLKRSWMLPFISSLMILGIMECLQRYDQKKMTFWLVLFGIFYHLFPLVLVFRLPVRKRIHRVVVSCSAVGGVFLLSCLMSDRWPYLPAPTIRHGFRIHSDRSIIRHDRSEQMMVIRMNLNE